MLRQKYWLGLSLVPQIGATRIHQLLSTFGTPEAIWHASQDQLRQAGLSQIITNNLLKARHHLDLDHEIAKIQDANATLMTWDDEQYPQNLRTVVDAPLVLYIKGYLLPTDDLALSIVGTRRASRYGLDVTERLAHDLAVQGVTIVSGMALGIDTAAHQGALTAGGRTIAVLGCGIDVTYPRENQELSHNIAANGALISEFPLGMPPVGKNFPRRNRIISGISLGVLVAEAPKSSGALISAETALEQGRDVFAVPSNIFNTNGAGCNQLIQDGAKLVTNANDILDELNITYDRHIVQKETESVIPDNPIEQVILNSLDSDPIHIDDITRQTKLPSSTVASTLAILELKGLAQSIGAMQYCRSR